MKLISMSPIPTKIRKELSEDPKMKICIWNNSDCRDEFFNFPSKVEWEHAFLYAGKQIQEIWSIIGVCWFHHRGPGLDKGFNQYKALSKIKTIGQLTEIYAKYPKVDWYAMRNRLARRYADG